MGDLRLTPIAPPPLTSSINCPHLPDSLFKVEQINYIEIDM